MVELKTFLALFLTPQTVEVLALYLSVSASSALVRVIFSPQPRFVTTFSVWIGSTMLGALVGFGIHNIEAWKYYDIVCSTIFGLIGKEILRSVLRFMSQLEANPVAVIGKLSKVVGKITGGASATETDAAKGGDPSADKKEH